MEWECAGPVARAFAASCSAETSGGGAPLTMRSMGSLMIAVAIWVSVLKKRQILVWAEGGRSVDHIHHMTPIAGRFPRCESMNILGGQRTSAEVCSVYNATSASAEGSPVVVVGECRCRCRCPWSVRSLQDVRQPRARKVLSPEDISNTRRQHHVRLSPPLRCESTRLPLPSPTTYPPLAGSLREVRTDLCALLRETN